MKPSMLSWASRLALIACAVVANCELSRAATSAARAGVVLAGDEWILEFYNTSAELEARQNDTWATGHFVPAGHEGTEGWNKFYVASNDAKPGEEGAYAAGYLEGALSHESIFEMHLNNYDDWFGKETVGASVDSVFSWLEGNYAWMKEQIESDELEGGKDEYWLAVGLVMKQLEGLHDGYNHAAPDDQKLAMKHFLLLNADGDVESLMNFLEQRSKKMRPPNPRCSALIKLAGDDVIMSHTTWDHTAMAAPRTLKEYSLKSAAKVRFSSSPAFLSSVDDFYVTSNELVVIETTNGLVGKSKLWLKVTEKSVLSWVRAMVANFIATSSKEWVDVFARYNSGTYNNQWMVVDLEKFDKGRGDGYFHVLEQIPGMTVAKDMTNTLKVQGHWASYNVPAFPKIFNASGFSPPDLHETCPRANIFRQRQHTATTIEGMKKLIRYNDYENDPLSLGNACNGIAARCDLNKGKQFQLDDAIDAKVISGKMYYEKNMTFAAQVGPTHDQQPPFSWSQPMPLDKLPVHAGHPTGDFAFEWIEF